MRSFSVKQTLINFDHWSGISLENVKLFESTVNIELFYQINSYFGNQITYIFNKNSSIDLKECLKVFFCSLQILLRKNEYFHLQVKLEEKRTKNNGFLFISLNHKLVTKANFGNNQ